MAQQYYICPNNRKVNITRQKTEYHCAAIELAVKQIELKKALAKASASLWCLRDGIAQYVIDVRLRCAQHYYITT